MIHLPPIRLYEFGTTQRWRNAIIKAVAEDVQLGQLEVTIEDEGTRYKQPALGTSLVNWYDVEVFKSGATTYVGCRCRAGENAVPCKHIARVFLERGWLPWPDGIAVRPPVTLPEPEEDLILSSIRGGIVGDVRSHATRGADQAASEHERAGEGEWN